MRFNIREMKKQGVFMGILAAFLAVVIIISYVTSLAPSVPTVEPEPEQNETQQQESNKPSIETPKPHTHKWSKGSTVKPTCTEGGYTINTCSCGQSKTTNETAALGHKLGEWVTEEPDENGVVYKIRKCENCDFYEKEKIATVGEKPENPEDPEDPEDPENPDNPENPENPNGDGGENEDENENQDPNPNPDSDPEQDEKND